MVGRSCSSPGSPVNKTLCLPGLLRLSFCSWKGRVCLPSTLDSFAVPFSWECEPQLPVCLRTLSLTLCAQPAVAAPPTPGLSFLQLLHLQETQLVQGKVIFICGTCCRTDRVKEDEKHVFWTYKILKEDKIIKQEGINCQTSERQQCGRMHDSLLHEPPPPRNSALGTHFLRHVAGSAYSH